MEDWSLLSQGFLLREAQANGDLKGGVYCSRESSLEILIFYFVEKHAEVVVPPLTPELEFVTVYLPNPCLHDFGRKVEG